MASFNENNDIKNVNTRMTTVEHTKTIDDVLVEKCMKVEIIDSHSSVHKGLKLWITVVVW